MVAQVREQKDGGAVAAAPPVPRVGMRSEDAAEETPDEVHGVSFRRDGGVPSLATTLAIGRPTVTRRSPAVTPS
ncbi:hypothetical protein GCM10028787_30310 [Brachybacterium horti]